MWRNPRVILGAIFAGLLAVSQGIDQFTQSRYPTPALTAELVKTAIVSLSVAGIGAEVVKRLFPSRDNEPDKPTRPTKEEPKK